MKGAYHEAGRQGQSLPSSRSQSGMRAGDDVHQTTGRRHEAALQGRSLPSSRSQSGMRAGDDVHRDDGATARGRAPEYGFPPPLSPSQGCEWGTTSAQMTGRRHEAGRQGRSLPSSRSQSGMPAADDVHQTMGRRHEAGRRSMVPPPPPPSRSQPGMRAGDDDGGTTRVRRGRTNQEYFRPGRPLAGSPVNSFPQIELGAPR